MIAIKSRQPASAVENKITWLRISYWTGAILDFIIAIAALIPANMGVSRFVYPMGAFSAAATSWGVLLIFANNKPVERRWVLLPTLLIVILGIGAGIYSVIIRVRSFEMLIPELIAAGVCISLWTFSYINSGRPEKEF